MATAISAAPGSRTNQEAWISLGDATFSLWIEQGIKYGLGPDGQYHTGVWFWEYRRPGDTSPVFHLSSFSFIGDIPWGFHYHGGNTWYLQRGDQNPINYTTVPSAPGPTQAIIAGTEFTYNENLSCGQQTLLAYQLFGSTTQHYAWNTPTNFDAFPYSSGSGTYSLVNDENFYFTNYC